MALSASMNAGQRRLVFGLNVLINALLAAAVAVMAVWAAGRFGGRIDVTSSGVNSLSPATVKLVRSLPAEVTITGIYTSFLQEARPHAEKHQNMVRDLLDLYETAGKGKLRTQMIDPQENPAAVEALLKRLADKPAYKGESAPHEEALKAFPELEKRIGDFATTELRTLQALAGQSQQRELVIIARNLDATARAARETGQEIAKLTGDEIKRYGRAIQSVREFLTQTAAVLEDASNWMADKAVSAGNLPAEAVSFFEQARTRYQPIIAEIRAAIEKIKDLKPVKLEDLYETLKRGENILVETPDEAEVLNDMAVWPARKPDAPPSPDGDPQDFAGEQATSSALLRLTRKEKTGVIVVRFGGQALLESEFPTFNPMQPPPEAPMSLLKSVLEDENFVTAEWDVKTAETPPVLENVKRSIYIVFPPEPPPQPNPMQPSREPGISEAQKQKVLDAIDQSGMAIFLTGWTPPQGFMPMPTPYAYADALRSRWGIEVKSDYLAVAFGPHPENPELVQPVGWQREGPVLTSGGPEDPLTLGKHPLVEPISSLPVGMLLAAPLGIAAEKPAGVELTPLILARDSADIWAVHDFSRLRTDFSEKMGTKRYDDDLPAPFPLALAASNDKSQRLIVFSSVGAFTNAVINAARMEFIGNAITLVPVFPGNAELIINAMHWLTNESDRIAVRPRGSDVPRLKLSEQQSVAVRVFLVGVWPAIALLVGAGIWLIRRR